MWAFRRLFSGRFRRRAPGAIGGLPISAAAPVAQAVREAERADIVEQRFREELPLRRLAGEWHMLDHTDLAELIRLAKAADLVVLGQYPGDDSDGVTWLRPDDVMIDAGRPVLIVPYAGSFERVGRRVLIAWDGTREANRALHDALPLIGGAEAVTVMHVEARHPTSIATGPGSSASCAIWGDTGSRRSPK